MYKSLLPLLFVGTALYAAETDPMQKVCERLIAALEQETEALESINQPADIPAGLEKLRASLQALQELFAEDETLLWQYIDNTPGAKQPIVDVLEELALQFARMEKENFFSNAELREVLAPQVCPSEAAEAHKKAKREKLQEIDHDED